MRRLLTLVLFAPLSCAVAATIDVTTAATTGAGSIRDAISQVNALGGGPHTIRYTASVPFQSLGLLASTLPQITATDVTIDGNGRQPHIDGNSAHRILQIGPNVAKLTLRGIRLWNGRADRGACIDSTYSNVATADLILEDVQFKGCKATGTSLIRGGAVSWTVSDGSVTIHDSLFESNIAEATAAGGQSDGGALYTSTDLIVERSRFEGNAAVASGGGGFGGAIRIFGSGAVARIVDSNFRFNGASPTSPSFGHGGAIALICDDCDLQMQRSYLRGNSANSGGGVYAAKASAGGIDTFLTLTNVTLYNHSVLDRGGGVRVGHGVGFTASNNTFYNNDASNGAHLSFDGTSEVYFFRANLLAPTFSGNACDGVPTWAPGVGGGNLLASGSCSVIGGTSIPATPLGSIAADEPATGVGVLRFSGGAVIDSLAASQCEPRDARFQQRPIDGDGNGDARCDVGAYEFNPVLFKDSFE